MKLLSNLGIIFPMVFTCLLFTSCFKDKVTRTYTIQTPVFAKKADVLAGISAQPSQPVKEQGKIFWKGDWIFMSDPARGIHIIDNSNPSSPKPKAFINLPGNIDVAVKGDILYADLFTDLLVLDITNPLQPVLVKTIPNAFPDRNFVNGYYLDSTKVIVDWIKKDTTVDAESFPLNLPGFGCATCSFAELNSGSKSQDGKSGSMARLAIVRDNLFLVNISSLNIYSIHNRLNPELQSRLNMGWGIETVYPFKDKVFIGSTSGMFIADVNDPTNPQILGTFSHANSCDPVVADDNYAYVTLRSGNFCAGNSNQLDIIDVSNLMQPFLIKSFSMSNPSGLALREPYLYICDGKAGLKMYDATNKFSIKLKQQLDVADPTDIILNGNLALVVGKNGLYQYTIKQDGKLNFLSRFQFN